MAALPFTHPGRFKANPPHTEPGQVIGLLGGSFNPAHEAHRLISETARKRLGLDKVWWIVSPGNPLKKQSDLAPLSERLAQAREVAMGRHIIVTDFETDLPSPYTASTLAYLKASKPLVRFVWIMGADNLASFDRWQRWREIFTMVPIVVVDRPGWRLKALASKAAHTFAATRVPEADARLLTQAPPPAWSYLTGRLSILSSTSLRNKSRTKPVAKKAQPASRAVPKAWKAGRAEQVVDAVKIPSAGPNGQHPEGS